MSSYRRLARPPRPLAVFHKRALSRVLRRLPDEMTEWEDWDVMDVSRWRAPAEEIIAKVGGAKS